MNDFKQGSIWYDAKRKRYVGQIIIGTNKNGLPKKKTVVSKTKKECRMRLDQIRTNGAPVESKDTIAQICHIVANDKLNKGLISDNSYKRISETIRKIESSDIAYIPIKNVTEADLNSFLITLRNYSNSTIKKVWGQIRIAYRYAEQREIVKHDITALVTCPKSTKPDRKVRALTIDEQRLIVEKLRTNANEVKSTALLFSLFTACRMGEVLALQRKDIDLTFKRCDIHKTISRDGDDRPIVKETTKTAAGMRSIHLNQVAYDLIRAYIKRSNLRSNDFLFLTQANTLLKPQLTESFYKSIVGKCGLPTDEHNQHELRHTAITRMIESGMTLLQVSRYAGHENISTTADVYADVFEKQQRDAMKMMDSYLADIM